MASSLVVGRYVIVGTVDNTSSKIIRDGAVFQRDGEIVEVGPQKELAERYQPDEVIGGDRYLVMPGLINAHHHVGLTPFQMGISDMALEPWIIARYATADVDGYLDTLYGAVKMIESGITTVMHNDSIFRMPFGKNPIEQGSDVLRAYHDSGMRAGFSFAYRDQNMFVYEEDEVFLNRLPKQLHLRASEFLRIGSVSHQEYFDTFTGLYSKFGTNNQNERITHFLSPEDVPWCSDEFLDSLKQVAQQLHVGVHIHVQETAYQKSYGIRRWGKTPLAHLEEIGFLGPNVSCAHGTWFNDSDIGILTETGTMVCHNPSSNLRLKSGIAPLNDMLARGVSVALGIDEAGLNDDNDMLQEMRLAHNLHRIPGISGPGPTSHQILRMATAGAADVLLQGDRIGQLRPGYRADIALIGLDHITEPYLHPDTDMVDALVYRGRGQDVETVIVDGEVLMKNRVLVKIDKGKLWSELRDSLARPLRPEEATRAKFGRDLLPHIQDFFGGMETPEGTPFYFYNERQ